MWDFRNRRRIYRFPSSIFRFDLQGSAWEAGVTYVNVYGRFDSAADPLSLVREHDVYCRGENLAPEGVLAGFVEFLRQGDNAGRPSADAILAALQPYSTKVEFLSLLEAGDVTARSFRAGPLLLGEAGAI